MSKLKPFMVGENDMVAAENPEQALSLLKDNFGDGHYDFLMLCDVLDVSDDLDCMICCEDGEPIQTLREYIDNCNGIPQYLYGWE